MPFLLSIVLIVVGYFVRRAVEESPIFEEIAAKKQQTKVPVVELFRKHWLLVIIAALVFAGNNAAGYMTTGGFLQAYTTNPEGPIGFERTDVLVAVAFAAAMWFIFTLLSGYLADKIGRKRTYQIGFTCQALVVFPLFWLVNTANAAPCCTWPSRSSPSAWAWATARRRPCTPSCSRPRSASPASRSPTPWVPSSAARSPR